MEVFLVRHPSPLTAKSGLCIGQADVPLSGEGEAEIPRLVSKLAALNARAIVSSDLQRCFRLGLACYAAFGEFFHTSSLWREVNFGPWENRTWDELQAEGSAEYGAWCRDAAANSPPGGESFLALKDRVEDALSLLLAMSCDSVVVVTHAGPVRALCAGNLRDAFSLDVPYGSIHRLNDFRDL